MDKERVLNLLERFIDRSQRWIDDAEIRNDNVDLIYYDGQRKVAKEIRDILSNW
jgi:hypothetical protein